MAVPAPSCAAPSGLGSHLWSRQDTHLVCQEAQLLQEALAQPQLVPHRVLLDLCPQGLCLLPHTLLQGWRVRG